MASTVLAAKEIILERLSAGERLVDIGRSLGVSAPAISKQLVNDPDYQIARQISLDTRMAKREAELEGAETMVDVSRVSALLKHAMWRAEREAPSVWGAKSEVSHGMQISVTVNNPPPTTSSVIASHAAIENVTDVQVIDNASDSANNL